MATTRYYLALDLGAESGRGLLGRFDGRHLTLEEVHRFPNGPVRMLDTLHWDLPRLFDEIKVALRKAASGGAKPEGIGIDTWGVDFGLIGRGDTILGNPVHYRDARTDGMIELACSLGPEPPARARRKLSGRKLAREVVSGIEADEREQLACVGVRDVQRRACE